MLSNRALAAAAAVLCTSLAQAGTDWPSYNRTLTSDRYATVEKIDNKNVAGLKVICSFDTGEQVSFQSGLVQVDGALFGTTERDTFSIDPNTCKLNWRSHEDSPSGELKVNRGMAWLDHRVFRGTADGKVIAYDAKNGKRMWATTIADAAKGESVPAAPIAWNGMVFIGNAGGDNKGVKGRIYALVCGAEGRGRCGPRAGGAGSEGGIRGELEGSEGLSHYRRGNLDVLFARPGDRAAVRPRRQPRA
jgi:alcohol dehydrogenase (cytochrome c)